MISSGLQWTWGDRNFGGQLLIWASQRIQRIRNGGPTIAQGQRRQLLLQPGTVLFLEKGCLEGSVVSGSAAKTRGGSLWGGGPGPIRILEAVSRGNDFSLSLESDTVPCSKDKDRGEELSGQTTVALARLGTGSLGWLAGEASKSPHGLFVIRDSGTDGN